jgi:predicted HTH transcriptional regulator
MGGVSLVSLLAYKKRNSLIFQLREELGKNLFALIKNGEDENLEFKSSMRFDYKVQKPNKALESVILKTLAGFMNTRGGSLLIGVADDGTIVGLEADYNTLHRKDSDGYTQMITSLIAEKMGTPACRLVRILFHAHEGKEICRIIVLPSPVPVYVTEEKMSHFYIRTASGTREMNIQEAMTFIKLRWK